MTGGKERILTTENAEYTEKSWNYEMRENTRKEEF